MCGVVFKDFATACFRNECDGSIVSVQMCVGVLCGKLLHNRRRPPETIDFITVECGCEEWFTLNG